MAEKPKTVVVIRKRAVRKVPAKPAAPAPAPAPAQTQAAAVPPPFNFLQALFASFPPRQPEATVPQKVKRTTLRRSRIKAKQTAAVR
jgi:hypothetical protein